MILPHIPHFRFYGSKYRNCKFSGKHGDGSLFFGPLFCIRNFSRRLDIFNAGDARFLRADPVINRYYGDLSDEYFE